MADGITQLLLNWSHGDQTAMAELMPLVYDDLRQLARSYLRRERENISIQPTALVHEAYLRLAGQQEVSWENRAQFFALASRLMRNILVDHARKRRAVKRDGGLALSLTEADRLGSQAELDLVALDDALNELETLNPQHCRIVELRFFGGLSIEETAATLGVSAATVERGWRFARNWLRHELTK